MTDDKKIILVGITGASGGPLAVDLLHHLADLGVETHLIVSEVGRQVLEHETGLAMEEIGRTASVIYDVGNLAAPPSSGTFRFDGMVIIPCSMKTLSTVAQGHADNLISRAADVALKERRRLVLVTRESPLSLVHIENMRTVTLAGAVVLPPVMSFYSKPETIADMSGHTSGKVLDVLGIEHQVHKRWG